MKTRSMTFTALLAAILCMLSPMAIPAGTVPITLATFGVYLIASAAGIKVGTLAVIIYILIGSVGIPVFSGFTGGIQQLVGPTGGFLVGYIPCAAIIGFTAERFGHFKAAFPIGMVLGTAVCYIFGTGWYMLQAQVSFPVAAGACVLPFLIGDCIKIALASVIAIPVRKLVNRYGLT